MANPLATGPLQSFASLIDDAALRFEQEWEKNPAAPPAVEPFLPADPAARDRCALRLVQIDLEKRVAAGHDPRAEDYLDRFPRLRADPDDVFALVLTEAESRRRAGRSIDPAAYRTRFPDLADRLIARLVQGSVPRVPGYELLGELGRGGMGVVYKARQVALNRPVALKVVTTADRQSVNRFLVEVEAVAAVRHPNVIQVFDSGEHDGVPYLAMEYVDGGTLQDRLAGGPGFRPAEATALVAAVADGVDAVHAAGIVHRDLKPGNVLLASGGPKPPEWSPDSGGLGPPIALVPKVSDFGLAKRGQQDLTRTRAVMGTPAYMAPEQVGGAKFVGPAADVWALGVILYECLTGTRPFDGTDPLSVLNQVQTRPPARPTARNPAVPRDLELICLKCLSKEAHDRYPTAAALADDLRRFLAGKPVSVCPVGPVAQAVKWVRRNPVPAALVAAVLVGSLATTVAALVAREKAREAADAEAQRVDAEREAAAAATRQLEAERAEAAEKAKRDRAERETAVAAALRENDLQRVADLVGAAERDGLAVPAESRFAAANALAALARTDEAREKLEALVDAPDVPPELRPRVQLWLADMLLGADDDRARDLLRAARGSGRLTPADLAYADALDAETTAAAIIRLQDAVRHDPRHFPARRLLGQCLFVGGRLDETIAVGEVSRLLTRNHPDVLWPLVFAYALKGETARTRELFALLRPYVAPDHLPLFENLVKYLPAINAQFRAASGGAGPEPFEELYRELQSQGGAGAVLSPVQASAAIRESWVRRLPTQFRDALDDYLESVIASGTPGTDHPGELARDEVRLARLAGNMARRPEGFMLFVLGLALHDRAFDYQARYGTAAGHSNRFREMLAMSGDAFLRAADSHALIDVRSVALEQAAVHFALAARPSWVPEGEADRAAFRKAVEVIRHRLEMPEPIPTDRVELLARVCINAGEITTARRLLDEWHRREPESLRLTVRRAQAEFKGEGYHAALRAARTVLANKPDDPQVLQMMRQIEADCLARLRHDPDRLPEVAPAPRPAGR